MDCVVSGGEKFIRGFTTYDRNSDFIVGKAPLD
jgi:hypothetical protein